MITNSKQWLLKLLIAVHNYNTLLDLTSIENTWLIFSYFFAWLGKTKKEGTPLIH